MPVPSIVYSMPDNKRPVRGRPESSNAGFGRPDSFMPTHRVIDYFVLKNELKFNGLDSKNLRKIHTGAFILIL